MMSDYEKICLDWRNINYSVKKMKFNYQKFNFEQNELQILNNVNGHAESGNLIAILGSSGAGKTSLLAVISQRMRGNYTGDIMINGQITKRNDMIRISSFVPQFDITTDVLTAREHLYFMCDLRLGKTISKINRTIKINEMLRVLGINHIADSRISLLSGGERKKLNLATELLTDPKIIFCDEPTTGLDSYSALSVIKSLRQLTNKSTNKFKQQFSVESNNDFADTLSAGGMNMNKLIVCSIHQPTSEVFHCFSHVVLMHRGRIAYIGSAPAALVHFANMKYFCPPTYNPAEFYVNVLAHADTDELNELVRRSTTVVLSSLDTDHSIDRKVMSGKMESCHVGWFTQVFILLRRSATISSRTYKEHFLQHFTFIFTGFIVGLVYGAVAGNDQASIQSVQGFFFTITAEMVFGTSYSVLNFFPSKLPVIRRETGEHIYKISAYLFAIIIGSIPKSFIHAFVFWSVVYSLVGFPIDGWRYLQMGLTMAMMAITATSYGIMLSAFGDSPRLAAELAPPIEIIFILVAGIYKTIDSFEYWKYISIFYYANESLSMLFWWDIESINCPESLRNNCLRNGTQVLENYSYRTDLDSIWIDYIGLFGITLSMYLIGYCFIRKSINKIGYY